MPCKPGSLGHRTEPGRIAVSRIAATPDGCVAEVVIDRDEDSWARWHGAGGWSPWRHLAHATDDVDLSATGVAVLLSVVTWAPEDHGTPGGPYVPPVTRRFYELTADGLEPAVL